MILMSFSFNITYLCFCQLGADLSESERRKIKRRIMCCEKPQEGGDVECAEQGEE